MSDQFERMLVATILFLAFGMLLMSLENKVIRWRVAMLEDATYRNVLKPEE